MFTRRLDRRGMAASSVGQGRRGLRRHHSLCRQAKRSILARAEQIKAAEALQAAASPSVRLKASGRPRGISQAMKLTGEPAPRAAKIESMSPSSLSSPLPKPPANKQP